MVFQTGWTRCNPIPGLEQGAGGYSPGFVCQPLQLLPGDLEQDQMPPGLWPHTETVGAGLPPCLTEPEVQRTDTRQDLGSPCMKVATQEARQRAASLLGQA